jgi:adenine deaminase
MSLIPGTEILLGGKQRVLAPLNAAAVKQFREKINAVFVGSLPDIEFVSVLAYHSLKRNEPEIKQEEVDEMIDYGNLIQVWEALMNVSGLAVEAGKMAARVQAAMQATGSPTQSPTS